MRSSSPGLVMLALLVSAWFMAACDSNDPGGASASGPARNIAVASLDAIDNTDRGLDDDQLAPDFRLIYANGEQINVSDWLGQPVILNFWATWCAPCRAEMPELVDAYEAHSDQGLVIVGVNVLESEEKAQEFMAQFDMDFPVVLDGRGELQQLYQVRGLPTTLFIDREGRIAVRWAGLLTTQLLEQFLQEIM